MTHMPPTRWGFQQPNRIKAALSHGTIVVDAGARSSALDVTRRAQLLDRFVGVIPGPGESRSRTDLGRNGQDRDPSRRHSNHCLGPERWPDDARTIGASP